MRNQSVLQAEIASSLPALRRFAFSLTTSMADADDLVQQTVERLLTRPIPEDAALLQWAFRVCRNLWVDEYRAQRVRDNALSDPQFQGTVQVHAEDQTEHALQLSAVGAAMTTLPAEQHEVLVLVAVQGMSYREVSETLEIPIGTVMSRLARARVALADRLNQPTEAIH